MHVDQVEQVVMRLSGDRDSPQYCCLAMDNKCSPLAKNVVQQMNFDAEQVMSWKAGGSRDSPQYAYLEL